jgi:hypothetical protein
MDLGPVGDLDARSTLAAATCAVRARRAAEVQDLLVISHWAALHGNDPRRGPDGERIESFGNRLVDVGGDGTRGCRSSASVSSRSRARPGR